MKLSTLFDLTLIIGIVVVLNLYLVPAIQGLDLPPFPELLLLFTTSLLMGIGTGFVIGQVRRSLDK